MNKNNSPEGVVGQRFAKAKREWHNLSKTHLASYAVGFETPCLVQPLTGNTTVVLDMDHAIQTNPTVTPVFDSMTVNVRAFFAPARLYARGLIGNNFVDENYIEDIELPTIPYSINAGTIQSMYGGTVHCIMPGSLLDRLGYPASMLGHRGWYGLSETRAARDVPQDYAMEESLPVPNSVTWNLMPIIAYYDICARYLSNPYDLEIPFARFSADGTMADFLYYEASELHYLHDIQEWVANCRGYSVDITNSGGSEIPPIASLFNSGNYKCVFKGLSAFGLPLTQRFDFDENYEARYELNKKSYQHGLWPARYKPDYTTTYFDNEEVDNLMQIELVSEGDVTVESYRLGMSAWKRKLRSMLNGKKFDDWVEIHFGYNLKTSDHPVMVGKDSYQIRFNDVYNQAAGGSVPLGAAASRGDKGTSSRKQISFTTQEPGFLFVILDIVPHVSYSGFNPNWLSWDRFADFPLPEYSGRAFQDLTLGDVCAIGIPSVDDQVVGQQPIYYDFMINRNTLGGLFGTDLLNTYTFKRKFDVNVLGTMGDVYDGVKSTYMEKFMYDYAFPDWGQNGGENIFIKSQFGLRLLQPIARDVIKNHV